MSGPDRPENELRRSGRSSESALSTDEGPALRDARSIADRITEDEMQVDEAREFYESEGLPLMEADAWLAGRSLPDEVPHAVHRSAMLELGVADENDTRLLGGTLYLTSQRLLHAGSQLTEVPLSAIDEMAVALERLLMIRLDSGADLAIEVDHPRLLRLQIATAKKAALDR